MTVLYSEINGSPMSREMIKGYFRRIGLEDEVAEIPEQPDIELLGRLHQAHISHIPYENIDFLAGRRTYLDRDVLYDKIIKHGRGGVCSELNTLYNWLLESLGYDVVSYNSRIIAESDVYQSRGHRIMGVRSGSDTWLTDVGFNYDHHRIPLLLEEGLIQTDGECRYRLEKDDFWGWVMWQERPGYGWRRKLGFTEEPNIDLDYVQATFFAEAYPESRFNKMLKVSIHRDGVFHAIRSGEYLVEHHGIPEVIEKVDSRKHEQRLLREIFGLDVLY